MLSTALLLVLLSLRLAIATAALLRADYVLEQQVTVVLDVIALSDDAFHQLNHKAFDALVYSMSKLLT